MAKLDPQEFPRRVMGQCGQSNNCLFSLAVSCTVLQVQSPSCFILALHGPSCPLVILRQSWICIPFFQR